MMKTQLTVDSQKLALVFRHRPYQGLGALEPVLRNNLYDIEYAGPQEFDFNSRDPTKPDLTVFLGGPYGVNDKALGFISKEIAFARERIVKGRPVIGICLGSQILARALDAVVFAGDKTEIGWSTIRLRDRPSISPLRHLSNLSFLHWHGDTFSIPAGCTHLASSDVFANQAFSLGRHVLALQFHVEVDPSAGIEDWISDHIDDITLSGIHPASLRQQTLEAAAGNRDGVYRMLEEWLQNISIDNRGNSSLIKL